MQLINDRVSMFDPIKNKPIRAAEVEEKFGVGPDKVVEVQALAGDSTDNVPGVPGIGVKTAAELIKTYGDVENLLAHAGEINALKTERHRLATQIDGFATRADQAEARTDSLRARVDVLQRERDAARAEAQAAAELRQADADRKARGLVARLRAAWRGE